MYDTECEVYSLARPKPQLLTVQLRSQAVQMDPLETRQLQIRPL